MRPAARHAGPLQAGLHLPVSVPESGEAPGSGAPAEGALEAPEPAGCSMSIAADAATVTVGEDLAMHGTLDCTADEELQGVPVTLYQHRAGAPGFDAIASTSTAPDGSYAFTVPALSANSAFYARYAAARHRARARSGRVTVKVVPLVTLNSSVPDGVQVTARGNASARPQTASQVTLSGTVGPDAAGTTVVLQRVDAGDSWRRVAITAAAPDGTYSFTRAFRLPGQVSLRVLARRRARRAVASEPVSFVVAARQNPALTIQASRARATSGQSLTVSGVVTGAHAAPVTLLARSGGESFQEVAHTATDGTGAFAFTQAPLANTTYLVRSDHIRSRALFQPVSFALSASASATSIAPGEAVTFSGSVGPPTGGQTVYLQRPDASGLGWHVVDTATVAPDGRYAITHVLAGAQSTVLRVRVPPANGIQAASSQAFTIEVSQPPAA